MSLVVAFQVNIKHELENADLVVRKVDIFDKLLLNNSSFKRHPLAVDGSN